MRLISVNPGYIYVEHTGGALCIYSAPPGKHFRALWSVVHGNVQVVHPEPFKLDVINGGVGVVGGPVDARFFTGGVTFGALLGSVWMTSSGSCLYVAASAFRPPKDFCWDVAYAPGGAWLDLPSSWNEAQDEDLKERLQLPVSRLNWIKPIRAQPSMGVRLYLNPMPPQPKATL